MVWSQCNYFRACLKVNSLICALCLTHLQKTWLANTSCGWPWSSPPSSARWATWRGSWARCCRRWRSPGNPSQGSRWCRGQTWCSRSISESGQDGWTATKDNILLKRKGASALKIKHENLNNNEHQVPQRLFPETELCKETPAYFFLGVFLLQGFELPVLVFVDKYPAPLDVWHRLIRQRA